MKFKIEKFQLVILQGARGNPKLVVKKIRLLFLEFCLGFGAARHVSFLPKYFGLFVSSCSSIKVGKTGWPKTKDVLSKFWQPELRKQAGLCPP